MAPREPTSTDFVFEESPGCPINYRRFNERFTRLVKEAGLPVGATPYFLRHSYASMMLAMGENPRWVADQLGHTNPALTLQVYAHSLKQTRSDAMSRLSARMSEPSIEHHLTEAAARRGNSKEHRANDRRASVEQHRASVKDDEQQRRTRNPRF